jgi:hypothetical protein
MAAVLITAMCGLSTGLGRRQLGVAAGSALASRLLPQLPARAADEMRTSASIGGYQDLTGTPGSSLGAGAISGKSRPRTGVCLIEPVLTVGSGGGKAITVQSLVALDGGVAATTRFESPWPLAVGMYYDVEVRNKEGDGAFLQVERLPAGRSLDTIDKSWFLETVFASSGRFGAYGVPSDLRVLKDSSGRGGGGGGSAGVGAVSGGSSKRLVEVAFSALTPGGSEQQRHALIGAIQPPGSEDAMLLVGGSTELRWRKGSGKGASVADAVTQTVASFELDRTRATKIPRTLNSDYRVAAGTLFP